MIDLVFAGYRSIEAGLADPLRVKWNGVRFALDVGIVLAPTLAAITEENRALNKQIGYAPELAGADTWQTPAQTLARGLGDCEDFAILKYAMLIKAGVPVRLVIGEIKSIAGNRPHAWCVAFIDGAWRALDNMFDQIIPISEYINWIPLAAMHDASVVRFGKQFTINEMLDKAKG